ncbi:hypothetical protein IGI37_003132 [Enterococcus sp. AZ194]|uniref:hypothetical protein n=1 Tax=Enterococcus sp. AZ194 TaxID=2774629 RepID=UPI003F1E9599
MVLLFNDAPSFQFGKFDSKKEGFYLVKHDAPTPSEKEIVEEIPYMQGVYDFSFLLGERVFNNRKITFRLYAPSMAYERRQEIQASVKEQLMINQILPLYDSYLSTSHWVGKCESVSVDDSQEYDSLSLTVVFDCYPFAIRDRTSYSDVFNEAYLTDGVDQWTGFHVDGKREILLVNEGVNAVSPMIVSTNTMVVETKEEKFSISVGENKDLFFKLSRGGNKLTVTGQGHVSFFIETEVMA